MEPSALVTEYLHENVGAMLRGGKARKDRKTGGWSVPVLCAVAGEEETVGRVGVAPDGAIDTEAVEAVMDRLSDLIAKHGEPEGAWEDEEAEIATSLTDLFETIMGSTDGAPKLDELTGLHSHGRFQERLDEEMDRALRYRLPFSCVFIDIDGFGAFNAEHGYQLGDALLRQVARLLSSALRGTDFLARWGSDEFVVIAQGVSADTARAADRVRRRVQEHKFRVRSDAEPIEVTVSVGAAAFPAEDVHDRETLLRRAQDMLLAAKAAGGNRVMIAHHDPSQPSGDPDG
jgi:diguanylate cyclase